MIIIIVIVVDDVVLYEYFVIIETVFYVLISLSHQHKLLRSTSISLLLQIITYSLSLSLYVGIGSPLGSIPLAATLSWIIKDGLGQLGKR